MDRRDFLIGAGGVAVAGLLGGCAGSARLPRGFLKEEDAKMDAGIWKLVEGLELADTHEHIYEEKNRIEPGDGGRLNDFGVLFAPYMDADLKVAGMPGEDVQVLLKHGPAPADKWKKLQPWWELAKNTGYGFSIRESLRLLYGIDDLNADTWREANDAIANGIQPGYYRHVIKDVANIHHCQVNTLEQPWFQETDYPEMLKQDLSFLLMVNHPNPFLLRDATGVDTMSLDGFLQGIDKMFETYGPRAVAIKNQGAYWRALDYEWVEIADAERAWKEYEAANWQLDDLRLKPLEDFLFHYCVNKAVEYDLPVKLHTGYHAGSGGMPLGQLAGHPAQMTDMCRKHPDAKFVFMHMTYPYQEDAIAVAKHYPNAWIDMCWGTIINPVAAQRFLKSYLVTAPSNKVLCFGGDFTAVELVPGHAWMARRTIAGALSELLDEGWIRSDDVEPLARRLCLGNALDLFDV